MSSARLKAFIKDSFKDKELIIVSNREPYLHKKAGASVRVERPAGGLTSAMDEALRSTGGTWVAWGSGGEDRNYVDEKDRVAVPPNKPAYTLKRVWLTPDEIENYYHGYSNHVLWPLCHIALDRVYFRKKYWEDYKKVNSTFADAVLKEATDTSFVWIHDYHLCLVPEILKKKRPDLPVAHFWHIPWPNFSVLRICPQANELIEALLYNDLIGFQIPHFVHNFMECVRESIKDAEIDYKNDTITYNGHKTFLKAFPISVDFEKFNSLASSLKTTNNLQKIKNKYSLSQKSIGIGIGIGVDRLEYTKGLIKRLRALDLFFERYPEYRGKFSFIQIAVPTRMKEPYISYKATVERLVRMINKKYSIEGWNPIIYRDTKSEHEDLAAYYRLADIAIISSIYDGMNLVAKEFIASQVNKKGVLVLSELAGAAEELEGAILVNPYDVEEFSDSIKTALDMPEEEKMCNINMLRRQISENDIYAWIADFLRDFATLRSKMGSKCLYLFDHLAELPREDIFLFLDYDGTLTPIVESPDKAIISMAMRNIIIKLNELMPVVVITGRSIDNIKEILDIDNIIYAGNHGAEIWAEGKLVSGAQFSKVKADLQNIVFELTEALSEIEGVIIEDKGITASVHYRMVPTQDLCKVINIFWSIADSYKKTFTFTSGKKVFEVRPHNIWNKGDAVRWILQRYGRNSTPIYIGDDRTDEDAFRAIKGKGVGISVGWSDAADFYLETQEEVKRLLQWIVRP
jgi:alpha,alpha-trehalose-phosphate synthase [UDP-forming]/trehalose-phosphatase